MTVRWSLFVPGVVLLLRCPAGLALHITAGVITASTLEVPTRNASDRFNRRA